MYCIVLYCIVLWGPILMARLDRYCIGIPRELSEIRTQPWLSEGSLTCDPCHHRGPHLLIARRRNSINSVLFTISWMTCLFATREPRSNHQPFDCWRAHHVYYVASQPRTSDRLISHWRALCLLAHDNWRCSIQPEIFTHQNFAWAGIRSRFDSGRVLCAYR